MLRQQGRYAEALAFDNRNRLYGQVEKIPFDDVQGLFNNNEVQSYNINPRFAPGTIGAGLPGENNDSIIINTIDGQQYRADVRYDPNTNQIYPLN